MTYSSLISDTPMTLDTAPIGTSPTIILPSVPKKRRRKDTPPVPDTAPARNTRSYSRVSLATTLSIPGSRSSNDTAKAQQPPIQRTVIKDRPTRQLPKSRKKPVTKPATQIYRVLPRDMPDDLGGLQVRYPILFIYINMCYS